MHGKLYRRDSANCCFGEIFPDKKGNNSFKNDLIKLP